MKWLTGALCLLIVAGLAWIGGELHYRNCLSSAPDRVTATPGKLTILEGGAVESEYDQNLRRLRQGCSRLPF